MLYLCISKFSRFVSQKTQKKVYQWIQSWNLASYFSLTFHVLEFFALGLNMFLWIFIISCRFCFIVTFKADIMPKEQFCRLFASNKFVDVLWALRGSSCVVPWSLKGIQAIYCYWGFFLLSFLRERPPARHCSRNPWEHHPFSDRTRPTRQACAFPACPEHRLKRLRTLFVHEVVVFCFFLIIIIDYILFYLQRASWRIQATGTMTDSSTLWIPS